MCPTPWDFVDNRMDGGKDESGTRQEGNFGASGDFGSTAEAPTTDVPLNSYPNLRGYGYDESNSQFSSDKGGDPQRAAEEASGESARANDLIEYLNNSPYVMGSRVCHELKEKQTPAHPSGGKAGPGDGKTGPDTEE